MRTRGNSNQRFPSVKRCFCVDSISIGALFICLHLLTLVTCQTPRPFPPLFNTARGRPVTSDPTDSTCGIPNKNAFCRSTVYAESVAQCVQEFCVQTCPNRTSLPVHLNLLQGTSKGLGSCIVYDSINVPPEALVGDDATFFVIPGPDCFLTPMETPTWADDGAITIATWVWLPLHTTDTSTLFQKVSSTTGEVILGLEMSSSGLSVLYQSGKKAVSLNITEVIPSQTWTHLTIQIYGTDLSLFVNGLGPGFSATQTLALEAVIKDSQGEARVGKTIYGQKQFLGRLQDFRFYAATLSNREISEVIFGVLPSVRIQSECRCPQTHPRVQPSQQHYCLPNGAADVPTAGVLRTNPEAHLLEYINDGDSRSVWVSKFMEQITLTFQLGDVFQVFYVSMLFYSPMPKAVLIERQRDQFQSWQTWQMYAEDCVTWFGQPNDGPLATASSVNCIQFGKKPEDIPYSKGNITFSLLATEPVTRPGNKDFYNNQELQGFVEAYNVRIHFSDHYHVTTLRHEYYGIFDLSITGRCDCNGHASECDISELPYKCNCTEDSHTIGDKCDTCHPLFNNKPFRKGTQSDAFPCRPCVCYDHSDSCRYDAALDPFPNDHMLGGGGVCQNCQHNTTGRFCDTCIEGFYRPTGKSKFDIDMCSLCNCFTAGTFEAKTDCSKEGGQCFCKSYVGLRRCDSCLKGYFNLQATNPEGCERCNCDQRGTVEGNVECHQTTGECSCKANVRDLKCNRCEFGFYNLSISNPQGCSPCQCNPLGSTSQFCDPSTGQCSCKANIVGRKCDMCASGYYNFVLGCTPCNCSLLGTVQNTICDPVSGQCQCKPNTQGLSCEECRDGSFGFGLSPNKGCQDCVCDLAGTLNSSLVCDKSTGSCVCKTNVEGISCNKCSGNTFGLDINNEDGCSACDCDPSGTQGGDSQDSSMLACDQNTGQCSCLANRIGRKCDDCGLGYFYNSNPGAGCQSCGCYPRSTIPLTTCDSKTGQCQCRADKPGVIGRTCSECKQGYFNYVSFTGDCSYCDCSPAGSVNLTQVCDETSGQCFCKEFVTSRRCDTCVSGASYLDQDNPYGCSKAPTQQPPPMHEQVNSTALYIFWQEPDYPNGVISNYKLYRNGTLVFNGSGEIQNFTDIHLSAYVSYSYVVEATNAYGKIQSAPVVFRTLPGPPTGMVIVYVTNVKARSASFSWNQPVNLNGPLVNYSIYAYSLINPNRTLFWTGISRQANVTTFVPFTNYTAVVVTCSPGGCLDSWEVSFSTKSDMPTGMEDPAVTMVSDTDLLVSWKPPTEANGIIIFYELWIRGHKIIQGQRDPQEERIFHPSGQYNPRPTQQPGENVLPEPATSFLVTGLTPFTKYEFQVLAENNIGKTASAWVVAETGEATPLFTPAPGVKAISSTEMQITWLSPLMEESRGPIKYFLLYFYKPSNLTADPFAPPALWTLLSNLTADTNGHMVTGLIPFTNYTFMLGACNSVGCMNSSTSHEYTLQAAPKGLFKPSVVSLNSTVMELDWNPPTEPNGPDPMYYIQKTIPSLSYPSQVELGTRFPGGGYYKFPSETFPANVGFTGIRLWFKTRQQEGLLMFAASPGKQEEFIALQFRSGRPWFLFDPQDCASYIEINPQTDNDRVYNDDKWHLLRAMRDHEYMDIQIDEDYRGCASFVSTVNDEGLPYADNKWHYIVALRNDKIAHINIDVYWRGCSLVNNSMPFVTPTNDEGLPYEDNNWHEILVQRIGKVATISVDSKWQGTRENTCATGTIIGPSEAVYIGGLPHDFVIRRTDSDNRVDVIRQGFQGCIRDVEILQQVYPTEVWKPLDWETAEATDSTYQNWQGCATNLDRGHHFQGQGYLTISGDIWEIRIKQELFFKMRTDMHTGTLFFVYGGPAIYAYIAVINGNLYFEFSNGKVTGSVTYSKPGVKFCDGRWYDIRVRKVNQEAEITVFTDDLGSVSNGDPTSAMDVVLASDLYVGGVPPGSEADYFIRTHKLNVPKTAFGGCLADLKVGVYRPVYYTKIINIIEELKYVENVNLDGCSPYHPVSLQCRDDDIEHVYNGTETYHLDSNLNPYSDYLYRVIAENDAGSVSSIWVYGQTKEGPPQGLNAPYNVQVLSGYVIQAQWSRPAVTAGLLILYALRAYNLNDTTLNPVQENFTNVNQLSGELTNVMPATLYSVYVVACTSGGCTESSAGVTVLMFEEAPQNVRPPTASSGTTYLNLHWLSPDQPNGKITGYFLYQDSRQVYSGGLRTYNLTGLQVFTGYRFHVRACTKVGCTDSPMVIISTSQLPPSFIKPPKLVALGTTQVDCRWEEPEQMNGVLQRYLLYTSTDKNFIGDIIYNNSDAFTDYIIPDLIAGTTYFISVAACTLGGCTVSVPSNVTTSESSPEGVQPPVVISPTPTELMVTWSSPTLPNGNIIRYELYHNEVPVYSGLEMSYNVTGLAPYSLHALRVSACTVRGCGSSVMVQTRTQEAAPEGFIVMELKVTGSRSIEARWGKPGKENGVVYYNIQVQGSYYLDPKKWNYTVIQDRRTLFRGVNYSEWVPVDGLIPMTTYVVQVNASTAGGFILSNSLNATLPPGAPDGVFPPELKSETPTSVTAVWQEVGRNNALDLPQFVLQFREMANDSLVQDVFGPTTSFTYTKGELTPYTEYEFRLKAFNSYGATHSEWKDVTTLQDRPTGVEPPLTKAVGARYIDLHWQLPASINGVIKNYNLYVNGQLKNKVSGEDTSYRVLDLVPFTVYIFGLEACTDGGCTRGANSVPSRTLEDLPEDLDPPALVSLTPTSVEITWSDVLTPNGLIDHYVVERKEPNSVAVDQIATVLPSSNKVVIDDDAKLSPFTSYMYRVKVTNGAGTTASEWQEITTMSARPTGMLPPSVQVLGPRSLQVTWQIPVNPNGQLEMFVVGLPDPRQEIRNVSIMTLTFENLPPYTVYSVTVTACTDGGCAESVPVKVRTDPTIPEGLSAPIPTPVSQNFISVVWQPPIKANGPNLRFELSRMKIRQPLEPNASGFNLWRSVISGTTTYFEDKGLPMFTTFIYRVTAFNDVGQLTSNRSQEVTTYGGFPRVAANVTATALDHVSILVAWEVPSIDDLQGSVKYFTLFWDSTHHKGSAVYPANVSHVTVYNLVPNTEYNISLTVTVHGGANITNEAVLCTTLDGAPEGMAVPVLMVINDTTLRVSWTAPVVANGEIIGYNIYINNNLIHTNMKTPGSYVVNGLLPYTVYNVQMEVCTVYDCARSAPVLVTTSEAPPQQLSPPDVFNISATSIRVQWSAPSRPNGIILRYDLFRSVIKQCSEIPAPTMSPEVTKCTYVECGSLENICGGVCYSGPMVCCDGKLHESQTGYDCCGKSYVSRMADDDVCCGGMFYKKLDNYTCCKDRYIHVKEGEICCTDPSEDRVTVSRGDNCCKAVPYSSQGSQICCQGQLVDGYNKQCCGGVIVSLDIVCCGNSIEGSSYKPVGGFSCCGQSYVPTNSSLCCTSDTGHTKVHVYPSADSKLTSNEKCCGLEKISQSLGCCNYVGFNALTHVCADTSSVLSGCGYGVICPIDRTSTALCDRCDFDRTKQTCGAQLGFHGDDLLPDLPNPADDCVESEKKVYTGKDITFSDIGLSPYTWYGYAFTAANSAGGSTSAYTKVRTLPAPPTGVPSPRTQVDPSQLYVIYLEWDFPAKPNGIVTSFVLDRDGVELYRGMDNQFTDGTTVLPYKSYTYTLSACNKAGCTAGDPVTIATAEGPPEDMQAPKITGLTAHSLTLSWLPPARPNGIIKEYKVKVTGVNGYEEVKITSKLTAEFGSLTAFTVYNASVEVCTDGGCTRSPSVSIGTLEDLPSGVQAPRIIVLSSTTALVMWAKPIQPNGVIRFYSIMRSWSTGASYIYVGLGLSTTDVNLTPGETYHYVLQTGTQGGGNTSSQITTITMPTASLVTAPTPDNVTVLSATKLYIAWTFVMQDLLQVDQYMVWLNAGLLTEVQKGVGLSNSTQVSNLQPNTEYDVRIQACLKGVPNGCSTGPGVKVRTSEAPPENMPAPVLLATGSNVVEVSWKPPLSPNGIITQYLIYYRKTGSSLSLLINRVKGDVMSLRHAGNDLTPFTSYEYQIVAGNSKGDVASAWVPVKTLEAVPSGMALPSITYAGSHGFSLSWGPPALPNGVISKYTIYYRRLTNDPTISQPEHSVTVSANYLQTSVSSLRPFSTYQVKVVAFNAMGNTSSAPVNVDTLESSPSGMPLFSIEKVKTGTSVILNWEAPAQPNGVISVYNIYEGDTKSPIYTGLNREFEFRRLKPYTSYQVWLEACTLAGCTRGQHQTFVTAEIAPVAQLAPKASQFSADSITITWNPPLQPNGKVIRYEVLRLKFSRTRRQVSSDATPDLIQVINETDATSFSFTDSNLEPFSEYHYSINTVNTIGSTQSPWQTVFTEQAAPQEVSPPSVSYTTDSSIDSLLITWSVPLKPNGVIQSYQLQRNESVPWSFAPDHVMEYEDSGLAPYTIYSYRVTVCTAGGCTTSPMSLFRTREAAPLLVTPPTVFVVNSTAVKVTWNAPLATNGDIIKYKISVDDQVVYQGLSLSQTVGGLTPYQEYTFTLSACTLGGCTNSGEVKARSDDAAPRGLDAPILKVTSYKSIEVNWSPPREPNGVIISYDLRRNDGLIYTESVTVTGSLGTVYTDFDLEPGVQYSYKVIARNRKGSVESLTSTATTFASSPSGLSAPELIALSSTSVQVSWQPPAKPNGVLGNYTLFEGQQVVFSAGPEILSYVVPGLQFWTQYEFRIQACTEGGCQMSPNAQVRTLESAPEEQNAPNVLALGNLEGAHTGILVTWESPLKPNGVIKRYELLRRSSVQEVLGTSYGPTVYVYNGTFLRFTDDSPDLLPFSTYQYRVSSYNTAGHVTSLWQSVQTKEGPPMGVSPPVSQDTTSTTITVNMTPPTRMNGILLHYSVLVNGSVASTGTSLQQTVGTITALKPFTLYELKTRVCTKGGCSASTGVMVKTKSALPSGQSPVSVLSTNGSVVNLGWTYPTSPNGQILRFIIYQRYACPPTPQPFSQTCDDTENLPIYSGLDIQTTVLGLTPYTAFEFQLQVENQAGFAEEPLWVRTQTRPTAPEYVQFPILQLNGTIATVAWQYSFHINGQLKEFTLVAGGRVVYRGQQFEHSIADISTEKETEMTITVVTLTGQADSPVIIFDPNSLDNIGSTSRPSNFDSLESREFYQEVWFIVLLVLLAIFLLFLVVAMCIRQIGSRRPYIRERSPLHLSRRNPSPPFSMKSVSSDSGVYDADNLGRHLYDQSYLDRHGHSTHNPAYTRDVRDPPSPPSSFSPPSSKFGDDDMLDDDDMDYIWSKNQPLSLADEDDMDGLRFRTHNLSLDNTILTDTKV